MLTHTSFHLHNLIPSNLNRHMLMMNNGSGSGSSGSNYTMLRECDSCRSAQAAVYCRADLAYLCALCDADIHTANPISRRHLRVPVLSNYGETDFVDEDGNRNNYEALFREEVDEYLDLVEFNSCAEDRKQVDIKNEVLSECVVPVQCGMMLMKKDYETSSVGFSYSKPLSHRVSLLVPDNTVTDISNSYTQPSKGAIEHFSAPLLNVPSQFSPMDREARVLRYREKKKNRKFEKTIRYASRKAYAEARPRIKGRFAKRSDVELEVDQMFFNYVIPEDSYGIVPSF